MKLFPIELIYSNEIRASSGHLALYGILFVNIHLVEIVFINVGTQLHY